VNEKEILNNNSVIESNSTEFILKVDQIEFSKTCYYDIYKNGIKVGEVKVTEVPDKVACDSDIAKKNALDIYKKGLGLAK